MAGAFFVMANVACGALRADEQLSRPSAPLRDLELLQSMQGHAVECTLARPGVLSDPRRALLARLRPSMRAAYALPRNDGGPRVNTAVRCVVIQGSGELAITRLLFGRALTVADREAISATLPYAVRWDDESCAEGECAHARRIAILSPFIVEVREPSLALLTAVGPDVRPTLAAIVARRPAALEVMARRVSSARAVVALVVEQGARGLMFRRTFAGEEASDASDVGLFDASWSELADVETGLLAAVGARSGERVDIPWALLEVALADRRILERARARRAARERVVPWQDIDHDRPEALVRQAEARRLAARSTRDPDRRIRLLAERAELLERLDVLTADDGVAAEAVATWGEIGEFARAVEFALRVAPRTTDPAARALIVRALRSRPDALRSVVGAFRPDLTRADRTAIAEAVARAADEDIAWTTVEGSFETRSATAHVPALRPAASSALPVSVLAELLYVWWRAEPTGRAFALALRGRLRDDAPSGTEGLALRWPEAEGRWTWATVPLDAPPFERVRLLSLALAAQLPQRDVVEIVVPGTRPLGLRLAVEGNVARVVAVSRALRPATWRAIIRTVALPLFGLDAGVFPPPVLRLELDDAAIQSLAPRWVEDRGGRLSGGRCEIYESSRQRRSALSCTGFERGAEALVDVLVAVMREALGR